MNRRARRIKEARQRKITAGKQFKPESYDPQKGVVDKIFRKGLRCQQGGLVVPGGGRNAFR